MALTIMITAKLIKIETGAEYDGVVYDRYLVVESPNGVQLKIFDNMVTEISESDVGSLIELTVVAHTNSVHKVDIDDYGVSKINNGVSYTGELKDIDIEDKWHTARRYDTLYCIDVGEGMLLVNPHNEFKELVSNNEILIGDIVSMQAYRTDLLSVSH